MIRSKFATLDSWSNLTPTSKSGNFSSWRGLVAWRILHICWVSSRDTSRRSPSIISSSSWDRAMSLRASTGCSSCRGTNGVLRTCFLHPPNPSFEAVNNTNGSWFQTFSMFWMLCAFFWVIPRRLNFICRHFGILCLFHLHRWVGMKNYPEVSI